MCSLLLESPFPGWRRVGTPTLTAPPFPPRGPRFGIGWPGPTSPHQGSPTQVDPGWPPPPPPPTIENQCMGLLGVLGGAPQCNQPKKPQSFGADRFISVMALQSDRGLGRGPLSPVPVTKPLLGRNVGPGPPPCHTRNPSSAVLTLASGPWLPEPAGRLLLCRPVYRPFPGSGVSRGHKSHPKMQAHPLGA